MGDEQWIHSELYSRDQQAEMYGLMDTLFMGFYALGLYISGILGDKHDLRRMIAGGMWATAAIVLLFGLGALADIHALSFYAVLWGLNGLVQSSGWPANVAVMGRWFDQKERGAVLGVWSGNACLGNIVGTALVALMFALVDETVAWKLALVVAAGLVAFHGLIIHFFLYPDPKDVPYRHESLEEAQPEGIGFFKAWRIPGVLPYALSYACLKSVNYALFFWLPFYLTVSLHMDNSQAGSFSMLYDAGQIFGGFVGGIVSDRMGVRSPVVVTMLLLSWYETITLYFMDGASYDATALLLLSSGFMLGGPANLISTAISADLGTHESIRGDAEALSTVTGIIDGTGSIGAALVQYLVGYLANCQYEPKGCDPKSPRCVQVCSWGPVFVLLEVGTVLSCVCLAQLLYHELLLIRSRRRYCARES
ncbi:sugar phosphate exchanger, putative [Phytophthora infestans T30-4]|uniref:Sugar phosphate exchanger, putative n=1 Tax=Phytophthora infestans (strain T30-4) TaxID=403677 RepID=D0NZW4_PHYIT|nr:sugar phosphate exchanger, putative [Phytophthora infestans T30-4]EEY69680.1 sugar phosphate exchanger, putative [Phytophthora infestans T30-4]|eukprot:XP_002997092.1 sugar phosphate exchanger, putative [Phytophthora infestans T30-4]